MKYMLMFVDAENGSGPDESVMQQVGAWWEKHSHAGTIVGGERLDGPRTATTVEPRTGVVTDGPFLEAKESIGGYALIDVADLDAAIALARTWPASKKVEIRPILEM